MKNNISEMAGSSAAPSHNSNTFTFESLPNSLEELTALGEATLDTPFKTAALVVCALCTFAENRDAGIEMLNYLKGPKPLTPMDIQFIRDRFMDGKKYVAYSYFAGTSPENGYTPSVPYTITIMENSHSYDEDGYAGLFIKSSGADSARKIVLRRKGEQWFVWEQFLLPDIRKPKAEDPWA